MKPVVLRIAGSLVVALLLLFVMFGARGWIGEPGGVWGAAVLMAIVGLIVYRVWPTYGYLREFFTMPEAKRAYRPTWPHVIGAIGISLGVHLLFVLFLLTISRDIIINYGGWLRSMVIFAALAYLSWPAIVVKWRRMWRRTAS